VGRRAVLLLGAVLITACNGFSLWGDSSSDTAYLHVVIAQQQPQSSDLGVILEIQGSGGNYLSLAAQGGTLRMQSDGAVSPTSGACVPFDTSGVLALVLTPDEAEANLYANLYQLDMAPNQGDGGAGGPCVTSAQPVVSTVTPVSVSVSNSAQAEAGVEGGTGNVVDGGRDGSPDAAADGPSEAMPADAGDAGGG
jgi:hypothetical protein